MEWGSLQPGTNEPRSQEPRNAGGSKRETKASIEIIGENHSAAICPAPLKENGDSDEPSNLSAPVISRPHVETRLLIDSPESISNVE
jgi:hypothetical protein